MSKNDFCPPPPPTKKWFGPIIIIIIIIIAVPFKSSLNNFAILMIWSRIHIH